MQRIGQVFIEKSYGEKQLSSSLKLITTVCVVKRYISIISTACKVRAFISVLVSPRQQLALSPQPSGGAG